MNTINFPIDLKDNYTTTIEYCGKTINIKKYISSGDSFDIVQQCINAYDNGGISDDGSFVKDEIPGFEKNVLVMEILFNKLVVASCTDLKESNYDVLIASGFLEELKDQVINYETILNKIYFIIEKKDNISNVIDRALKALVEKIPNAKELDKLYSKVKKDLTSEKVGQILDRFKGISEVQK